MVNEVFWNQLDTFLIGIPTRNLNGQIGENRMGFERWPSAGDRNEIGEILLHRADAFDMAMVNALFQKSREHLLAYSSGRTNNSNTVIDYILIRKDNVRGESIALAWLRN